jgi:tripartite-type tricarboxylate transporter receptor subunit TctC
VYKRQIWHLAIAGLLRDQKIDPAALPWVPSNGAAPGLQDMVAGGIEVAPVSLPEARSLIDAGKVRSLAIMNDKPSALYPNVPTLKSAIGSDWTMAAWRGIVAPKGLPAPVRDKLAEAVRKVAASKEYNEFMASRGFGVIYAGPDDFAKFMVKSNTELGATMKAVGLVK